MSQTELRLLQPAALQLLNQFGDVQTNAAQQLVNVLVRLTLNTRLGLDCTGKHLFTNAQHRRLAIGDVHFQPLLQRVAAHALRNLVDLLQCVVRILEAQKRFQFDVLSKQGQVLH